MSLPLEIQKTNRGLSDWAILVGYRGSIVGYAQSQLYKMEHLACQGYMGEKRKRLLEKFGYDTKNAAHLIRLMRMAIEFLQTGFLIVKRPDREELLEIKKGQWSLEQVKQEATVLFQKAKIAYEQSALPHKPDELAINELCVTLCERHFSL